MEYISIVSQDVALRVQSLQNAHKNGKDSTQSCWRQAWAARFVRVRTDMQGRTYRLEAFPQVTAVQDTT